MINIAIEQHITSFVVEIGIGIAQTFSFCFVLFLNNPISNSICKLPIRSEIYNCTFLKTRIKFPLCFYLETERNFTQVAEDDSRKDCKIHIEVPENY